MSTFERLADLRLEVDGYELEGLSAQVSSGFERLSTILHLSGGGDEGIGEDVVYEAEDHVAWQSAGDVHNLAGHYTLGEFCQRIDALDLFPVAPQRDVSRLYRRWTFHSAALDLALRQAGRPLHVVAMANDDGMPAARPSPPPARLFPLHRQPAWIPPSNFPWPCCSPDCRVSSRWDLRLPGFVFSRWPRRIARPLSLC